MVVVVVVVSRNCSGSLVSRALKALGHVYFDFYLFFKWDSPFNESRSGGGGRNNWRASCVISRVGFLNWEGKETLSY